MAETNLIWPARLHHVALLHDQPKQLIDWYARALERDRLRRLAPEKIKFSGVMNHADNQ